MNELVKFDFKAKKNKFLLITLLVFISLIKFTVLHAPSNFDDKTGHMAASLVIDPTGAKLIKQTNLDKVTHKNVVEKLCNLDTKCIKRTILRLTALPAYPLLSRIINTYSSSANFTKELCHQISLNYFSGFITIQLIGVLLFVCFFYFEKEESSVNYLWSYSIAIILVSSGWAAGFSFLPKLINSISFGGAGFLLPKVSDRFSLFYYAPRNLMTWILPVLIIALVKMRYALFSFLLILAISTNIIQAPIFIILSICVILVLTWITKDQKKKYFLFLLIATTLLVFNLFLMKSIWFPIPIESISLVGPFVENWKRILSLKFIFCIILLIYFTKLFLSFLKTKDFTNKKECYLIINYCFILILGFLNLAMIFTQTTYLHPLNEINDRIFPLVGISIWSALFLSFGHLLYNFVTTVLKDIKKKEIRSKASLIIFLSLLIGTSFNIVKDFILIRERINSNSGIKKELCNYFDDKKGLSSKPDLSPSKLSSLRPQDEVIYNMQVYNILKNKTQVIDDI